jgi:hypothetical protein
MDRMKLSAILEYRWLNSYATSDKLAVSGEVNRMIAAATTRDGSGTG